MASEYREIYYASDDSEEERPIDELSGLEQAARSATPQQQARAMVHIARILEARGVMYGGMGGFLFWNLGNARRTEDVDMAVSGSPNMKKILGYLSHDPLITRPKNVMQWASGVARIFVDVDGQLVQIDLKRQGSEGQGIPADLEAGTEMMELRDFPGQQVRFFTMLHSVFAKFRALRGRDFDGDYRDLLFVCTDRDQAPAVNAIADQIDLGWRETFLARVQAENPNMADTVRQTLRLGGGGGQTTRGFGSGSGGGYGTGPDGPNGPGSGGDGGGRQGKKRSIWRRMFSSNNSGSQGSTSAQARSLGAYAAQASGQGPYQPSPSYSRAPPPRPGTARQPTFGQMAAGAAADYARTQAARPSTSHNRSRKQEFAMNQGLAIGGLALDYYAQNGRPRR